MSDSVVIRPVVREDFDGWKPLWDGYNAFYGREGQTALPDAVTRMTWTRFFDAYEPMHAFVAESEGKLLGLVHFLYHRTTIHIGPTCYLQDLFTSKNARGKGVGRALINAVYDHAKAGGANRVYWLTQEGNTTARLLYDKVAEKSEFVVYRKSM